MRDFRLVQFGAIVEIDRVEVVFAVYFGKGRYAIIFFCSFSGNWSAKSRVD